jgi:hypothetical protein
MDQSRNISLLMCAILANSARIPFMMVLRFMMGVEDILEM